MHSMRVSERKNSWNLLAIKVKERAIVERGEKSLVNHSGSELRLAMEKAKGT